MFEVALIFVIALGLAWPLGRYMAGVFSGQPHVSDRLFGPLERITYRLIGVNPLQGMTWKTYVWALLLCNLVLGGVAYLILSRGTWRCIQRCPSSPIPISNITRGRLS